ncbi:MAG: tetratricopeptide repeat protein [Nitrospirae bacterium]|nr:tetratricopeptide repeat protein [Nitrospirota bacterium]
MGKILPFPAKQPSKFGFERAGKHGTQNPDQINRSPARMAEVRRLPVNISLFEEALLLDERGDSRAAETYRRAIAEGDFAADAYCNLGIIESGAGRRTKAFDCFTRSLGHDPRHFESHYNLGNLYYGEDNLRLAKMHYELAAEINPGFANLFFNLGLVLALLEEPKAAIEAFSRYQLLAPPEERRNADDLIRELRRSLDTTRSNTLS